jgi:hypothetical protein
MKTKHLFTFFVLLSLTSSGMLLTEVSSSIAQANNPKPNSTVTKDSPKTSNKPEKESTGAAPKTIEPSSVDTDKTKANSETTPKDNKGDSTSSGNAVNGVSKTDGNDSSLIPLIVGGVSGLLHLLEIAGLVWGYLKVNQLSEKNRDSRSQIKSLTDRLSASEQKQKSQGEQLKAIGSEAANARNLTSRMNAIEQASQRKSNDIGYADPNYNLPSPGVAKAAAAPSLYPFLDTYRQSSDNFKNQYSPKIVSEDADNLQKRRAGDYQEIILGEDRQGNYWLFNDGSTTYLIPSPKLKINDLNIRTAGALFTCENYTPGYQHINIVRPAIVSAQTGMGERWKLEQKGVLEFA